MPGNLKSTDADGWRVTHSQKQPFSSTLGARKQNSKQKWGVRKISKLVIHHLDLCKNDAKAMSNDDFVSTCDSLARIPS